MSYKLFSFKNSELIINKDEILSIPSFNTILKRDKGSPGDSDGRKKLLAFKEFAYIYHMADINSQPNRSGYSKNEAKYYAKEKAGLPDNWKEDEVVKQAIKDYQDEQESLPRNTIAELIKTYRHILNIIPKVRRRIDTLSSNDELTTDQASEILNAVKILLQLGEDIPSQTSKLTNAIKQLEQLEDNERKVRLRGSKEVVPDSMIPERDF